MLVLQSNADRVQSESLCCWLRLVGEGDQRLIRLGLGVGGEQLFLSAEEFERAEREAERAEKERERGEKERERAEKEYERAEKEREHSQRVELEAKVRAHELELTRLKSKSTTRKSR